MPVHDWTRVGDWVFRDFRLAWVAELRRELNLGQLPDDHFSMLEDVNTTFARGQSTSKTWGLAVRRWSDERVIAAIEVVSPEGDSSGYSRQATLDRAQTALGRGVNLLVIDLHTPVPTGANSFHAELWRRLGHAKFEPFAGEDRALVSYSAGPQEAFVEPVVVDQLLPTMPLFLTSDGVWHIEVPLEATYTAAYAGVPRHYRDILEAPPAV